MKKIYILLFLCPSLFFNLGYAQKPETFKKNGYTLTFISEDSNLDPSLKTRMIATFFEVYPKLVKEYNTNSLKKVTFLIDTAYKGVAATSNGKVTFSSNWLKIHPEDIDVITHEVMHIVQDYGNTNGPIWLTEGIADYVRFKFGIDNEGAKWSLPDYNPNHSYTNSYRITARFLEWLENNGHKGIVKRFDEKLREKMYSEELWVQFTGLHLNELWEKYKSAPTL